MTSRAGPWLSNGRLVAGVSAVASALLVLVLSSPWDRHSAGGIGPLRMYCAAGLTKPVQEILKDYEKAFGVPVQTSYDGSGKLLSTLRAAGGRGDLYLASEAAHINTGKRMGLIAEVLPVGQLRPVLAVSEATYQNLETLGRPLTGLKDMIRDDIHVALANPEFASIGALSRQVLEKAGFWRTIQQRMQDSSARITTWATVNEVAQTLRTRAGFVGIVWSATAAQFGLHEVAAPELKDLVEPLQVGVLTNAEDPAAALKLARYLAATDRGGTVFKKHHVEPIADGDPWDPHPILHLSAGAMLKPGIDEAIKAFERREGVSIQTSYGGCGILVGQMKAMKQGATQSHFPDAYFACDRSFLTDVQPWFEAGTLVTRNPMVLIVPKGNPLKVRSLADLARGELRVGLAHPKNSALGKLTDDLLRKLSLHDAVYRTDRPRPVVHTDAAHLLVNQMRAGALDVAVVYRSNVLSAETSREFLEAIDLELAEAIASQPYAIAKNTTHKYLMRRLLQTLVAPPNAEHFRSLGFQWMLEAP